MSSKKGFTLIELLGVVVILAIILAIAIPAISSMLNSSKRSAFESNAKLVLQAAKYKMLEDESFDPMTVSLTNIKELLGLSPENYSQIKIVKEKSLSLTLSGKGKWDGLYACGTITNMHIATSSADCGNDIVPPTITIIGDSEVTIEAWDTYVDQGATAIDNEDGNMTSYIITASDVNPSAPGTYTVTYSVTDRSGNTATATRKVIVSPSPNDSLIGKISSIDKPDGDYDITINGVTYNIELITINGNTTYSSSASLGNTTADSRMLVVKYNGDLTIDSGVTVTAAARKKGMFIYVAGKLTNNGTITMTARGAIAAGQDVYLWKNADGTYEYVPAAGGAGGAAISATSASYVAYAGKNGASGQNRATGGGGGGAAIANTVGSTSGSGSAGTSYSGGSGGGALSIYEESGVKRYAGNAAANGGAGGYAAVRRTSNNDYTASGGAGNGPGANAHRTDLGYVSGNQAATSEAGTGGLLIIYSNDLINNGTISSNGSNAKLPKALQNTATGGSSGGGSINVFIGNNAFLSNGAITANGGISDTYTARGGAGGNGSVTVGYVYKKSFQNVLPNINFDVTSGSEYKQSYSITVTTSVVKGKIKTGSTKYVWTTSATAPLESEIINDVPSNGVVPTPIGVSGSYYLWVITKDNNDNSNIRGVGPFNIDDIDPVITITGSNPSSINQGESYTDAGATATDNKDGTLTVTSTSTVNPNIAGTYEVVYTVSDSAGNTVTAKRTVFVKPVLTGDSIIAAIRDVDLPDNIYKMNINEVTYDIELITINEDTIYSSSVNLGNTTADQTMLVVKYKGNLTIDEGVTVTAAARKKGMFIYVDGTLTNNGTISMTARGAIATGQDVYLWKNADGTYEYVPAVGAAGGASVSLTNVTSTSIYGKNGAAATGRATGGGGSGGVFNNQTGTPVSGAGGKGTSYSGGAGGGASTFRGSGSYYAGAGSSTGGAGGYAVSNKYSDSSGYSAGGGAGNPGGAASYPSSYPAYAGGTGTGGLLIIYANSLYNNGTISSDGSMGGPGAGASGGSSGGGSINLFTKDNYSSTGTITAAGGAARWAGSTGGTGSVTHMQINW